MRVSELRVPRGTATCPSAGELLEWKAKDFQANVSQSWHFGIFEVDLLSKRLAAGQCGAGRTGTGTALGLWLLLLWPLRLNKK